LADLEALDGSRIDLDPETGTLRDGDGAVRIHGQGIPDDLAQHRAFADVVFQKEGAGEDRVEVKA
jgi:hypothetical protein